MAFHFKIEKRYDDDKSLIYIRPYINGRKYSYVSTKLKVPPKLWEKYKSGNLNLQIKEDRSFSDDLKRIIDQAESALGMMNEFDYETWKQLFKSDDLEMDIRTAFQLKMKTIQNQRNKNSYTSAMNKLLQYPSLPTLPDMTSGDLVKIEEWMEHTDELSWSSIGIYMRSLRAVFNHCIDRGLITNYPFKDYQPPIAVNKKKALYPHEIKSLLAYTSEDYYNQRAADFWKICYMLFGKYPSDLMQLKWDQFREDNIVFTHRAKTSRMRTRKEFEVPLTEALKDLIEKWSNGLDGYVFNFGDYSSWNRRVNSRLKKIGKDLGIKTKLTLQTARHSAATKLIHSGAGRDFIRDAFGHKDFKTTDNYINSFANDYNKEFAQKLIE